MNCDFTAIYERYDNMGVKTVVAKWFSRSFTLNFEFTSAILTHLQENNGSLKALRVRQAEMHLRKARNMKYATAGTTNARGGSKRLVTFKLGT